MGALFGNLKRFEFSINCIEEVPLHSPVSTQMIQRRQEEMAARVNYGVVGSGTQVVPVAEKPMLCPTQASQTHNAGVWSLPEQEILQELLTKYVSESNIMKYAKIAMKLGGKTSRDVALRCRWMTASSLFLSKETGKRRNEDHNSERRNKNKKERVTGRAKASSHVANRRNGPPYAQTSMSVDNDNGISYKAIGGPTGQLLKQNAQVLVQISANFAAFKIHENINLFTQARNNILSILNDLNGMPMKHMPPLPVKLNEELVNLVLPTSSLPRTA